MTEAIQSLPWWSTRPRRVTILIVGVIALSLGDLIVTVGHLRSTGMVEANPIAEWLILTTGSVMVLGLYKAATVAVCVGLLLALRRRLEGEIGAWLSVLILAGMSVVWHHYSVQLDHPQEVKIAQAAAPEGRWLMLD